MIWIERSKALRREEGSSGGGKIGKAAGPRLSEMKTVTKLLAEVLGLTKEDWHMFLYE